MKMNKLSALAVVLALTVSACDQNGGYGGGSGINKAQMGTVIGGIGGGLAGNQFGKGKGKTAATIGGAILGGLVGNSFGQSLDRADQQYYNTSVNDALERSRTGTTSRWINPDSGNSGTVTPTSTFQNSYGQYCREYNQTIVVGGQSQRAYGTACRQPDGSWAVVSN